MSKYDTILNELVYQIDDIVYDFYSSSNDIISKKQNQENLLSFRDKTIATINDMNVRSLEIISNLKSEDLVAERSQHLLDKNNEIVASATAYITAANDKSEFVESVQRLADTVYSQAKDIKAKIDESGVVEKLFEGAQQGLNKVQKGVEELNQNPQFIKGKEVVIEKSKDVLLTGAKLVKEGTKKVSEHFEKNQTQDVQTDILYKENSEDLESLFDEVVREEKSDTEL